MWWGRSRRAVELGWERRRKDENGVVLGEEEEECLEAKLGEKTRELKRLQVDLRLKKALRGRNERTSSRSSSGSRLQTVGSIAAAGGFGRTVTVVLGFALFRGSLVFIFGVRKCERRESCYIVGLMVISG